MAFAAMLDILGSNRAAKRLRFQGPVQFFGNWLRRIFPVLGEFLSPLPFGSAIWTWGSQARSGSYIIPDPTLSFFRTDKIVARVHQNSGEAREAKRGNKGQVQ